MKILIIKLGAIGDVIRTTCIIEGLKEKYNGCKIDWLTKKISYDVLKNNKDIKNLYLVEELDKNELSGKEYDWVISLDDETIACEAASKIKSKKITGAFAQNNQKKYTEDSAPWFDMGLISKFGKEKADLMKSKNRKTFQEYMYKILNLNYKKQEPVLLLDRESLLFAEKFAEKNKINKTDLVIGINTGAGGRWQDKKLSEEKTAELIDKLNSKLKCKILLFGGPEEVDRNEKIKSLAKTKAIDAGCSNSLMDFSALVNLCNAIVSSDSLAMHIGVALKKSVVAFFCPTPSSEIELYGRGMKYTPKIGCLCCYKGKCGIPPDYEVDALVKHVMNLV